MDRITPVNAKFYPSMLVGIIIIYTKTLKILYNEKKDILK